MEDALRDGLSTVANFVPKLVLFLVILIVGIIIAKLIAKALNAILERVGFDNAVERGGVKKALSKSKMDASDIVAKLIYFTLVLIVLQLAFSVFGPNPVNDLLASLIAFLPSLIVAIIILVVAGYIASAVKTLIDGALGGLSYGSAIATGASVFILFLGIVAALNQIGVATTVTTPILIAILATVAGVIIVGVGGGLVRPMQQRWEGYLQTAEREVPAMKEAATSSGQTARHTTRTASTDPLTADSTPTSAVPGYGSATSGYSGDSGHRA
ncbi:hypothetical protein [Nocardioides sp.]|uniref:mechanosensitive ion channel family protein n=1 Tax=Nocardioides sp. TaxID=35761 RepID=UPI002732AF9B|nr:hypothetical protein [Nocardioides sp.]MDP3890127.1 hypothetical protein [Nocardioides sp.]